MTSLGFPARLLDGMQRDRQVVEGELAERFRTLGFAVRSPQATPSVAALARHADLADLYAFIYHATSATVHFRPGQLGRGVWGKSGRMVIDLTAVERRLADFGMYWGVRLALEAWITALPLAGLAHEDEHEAGLDHAGVDEAVRMLSGGSRPFVLPDEYRWENT